MAEVSVNLVVEVDLDLYAERFDIAGRRGARGDVRQTALEAVQHEFKRQGYPVTSVRLRRYGNKATE
ncbi:hypothetical protein SEA_ESTES_159 [Mycobacterium phage Estes]|uniref:Uncharacterized protein n=1 Tax=Mycobacterium phage Estes TaxID=2759459 RepID=A0A7G9A2K8_9CAUD|nr:hypothetical protein J4U03_gp116 [Mycobacterium phage Estes]QNL30847.1 hypothetical protein SEA_ESTES_159 [Mycobacterium phage Estes]